MLSREEIDWLNWYHQTVYDKISPYLNNEEIEWLKEATKAI
jgi:Xaa-Pro aminopeptidase